MMNKKIACIPLDGRPCCLDFVTRLGRIAGYDVQMPTPELFRNFMEETDTESIRTWLEQTAGSHDYLIISIDMLAYGGFFASSRLWIDEIEVSRRLEVIKKLKSLYPQLIVFASNIISRLTWAVQNSSELEICNHIVEYYQLQYRINKKYKDVDLERYKMLKNIIEPSYLKEYQAVRKRNHALNKMMIEWTKKGYIDFLLLSQADTSHSGPHREEQIELMNSIFEKELLDRVIIYSGADEAGQVLLARAVQEIEKTHLHFFPRFSSVNGSRISGCFEDMPLGENLKSLLYASGSICTDSPEEADIRIFINTPPELFDSDSFLRDLSCDENKFLPTPVHNVWDFVEALSSCVQKEQPAALVDACFANGCDKALVQLLLKKVPPLSLLAFAGWNTPGNSMGTAIAHSILRWIHLHKNDRNQAAEKQHAEFLFERFMDDYCYQSLVKPKINQWLRSRNILWELPENIYDKVNNKVQEKLHEFGTSFFKRFFQGQLLKPPFDDLVIQSIEKEEIYLPWQRTFEAAINYEFKISKKKG